MINHADCGDSSFFSGGLGEGFRRIFNCWYGHPKKGVFEREKNPLPKHAFIQIYEFLALPTTDKHFIAGMQQ